MHFLLNVAFAALNFTFFFGHQAILNWIPVIAQVTVEE